MNISHVKIKSTKPIAMIDDNIIDYEAAKRFIAKSNLKNELIHFISGEDFIDYLKKGIDDPVKNSPALALMDVNMPGLSGHQTTEIIRRIPEYHHIPIICMLTSSADGLDQEKARHAGANGFLTKPFDPQGYIDLFNSLL